MSERLNSVDIEDVLSSIRRLVSDDKRPAAQAAAPVAPAAPVADPQADKLILTPALRIAPEPEPAAESGPEPQAEPEMQATPPAAAPTDAPMAFHSVRADRGAARLDAVMGQVARGLESGSGDWEPASEVPSGFAPNWPELGEPAAEQNAPETVPETAPETASDFGASPGEETEAAFVDLTEEPDLPTESRNDDILSDTSGDVAARPGDPDVLPGAGPSDGWPAGDWTQLREDIAVTYVVDDPAWPSAAPAAFAQPDLTAPGLNDHDPADQDMMPADPMPSVALAEEPAMTDKDDPADWSAQPLRDTAAPDLPDWARMEDEAADPAMPEPESAATSPDPRWADAAEAEIRRELEEEVTASAFARFADDDLDDRPFDEEMLRDLVRDIIREELQGALGERITRNVRKLVRAEIARALAVRDFE